MALRRIFKEQVTLGMHVHSLEGSWLNHPFWRSRFVLTDPADVEALHASEVDAVFIDDEKGIAPEEDNGAESVADEAPASPGPVAAPPPVAPPAPRRQRVRARSCSASEEAERARKVLGRSVVVVRQLLDDFRLGKAADAAQVLPVVEDISASIDRNASALISISRVRAKDEYTYFHSVAVCALMINLARQLGHDEATVRELGTAGLLHDFGKVCIPDKVLLKPGPLTDDELAIVRQHPEQGYQVLRGGGYSEIVLDTCRHHHEKMDGSGYPHGLDGKNISEAARMGAICDVYDAITARRPYKNAMGPAESLAEMFRWQGHFDEAMFAAFVRSLGIFPVGSLVRLQSGRLALVVDRGSADSTRPVVRIFHCGETGRPLPPVDVDLSLGASGDAIACREDPQEWGFESWDAQWCELLRRGTAGKRAA